MVDVRTYLPTDPHFKKGEHDVFNSVAIQDRFAEVCHVVSDAACANGISIVGCTRGRHRSTTVARVAKERIKMSIHDVEILELNLLQPFMIERTVEAALDLRRLCGVNVVGRNVLLAHLSQPHTRRSEV